MSNVIDDLDYTEFLEAICDRYGYDFRDYAQPSVKRRITRFMEDRAIVTLNDLGAVLMNDENLFEEFVQYLSITVTEMFRDPPFYKRIRELMSSRLVTYPVIKIWLAGCATGQEAYSIAILLKEEGLLERSILYATDINQRSLQIAKQGIYALDGMKDYTRNYLLSGGQCEFSGYYTSHHKAARFDHTLNQKMVFSPHNLALDTSFNEFQLIICRNVIMYFNQRLQNKVIDLLYDSLCPFGYLGLGDKESLLFSDKRESFEEIGRREKIYRKIK